ncbi:metacaspase [Moniliophthora roreri MCA 2997]|uniref:Metacaspase n=2 Tax=Moniliophthora roreri TaxID=221103 RepID=V2YRP5_MONRO|nr:metacaspase [Moniliophthora roreri MCA 2997]
MQVNHLTRSQPIPIRKRALLIGIRYENEHVLMGSHNDVDGWKKLLVDSYGYREEDVIVMKDTKAEIGSRLYPNHANITRVLADEFILKNKENVSYFFLYSGHSGQTDCFDGTEEDNKNELIIPVDAIDDPDHERTILDDDLKRYLVNALPPHCKLVAVLDACHSGTLMDLNHYRCNRVIKPSSNVRRVQRALYETRSHFAGPLLNDSTVALADVLQCANQIDTAKTTKATKCTGLCPRSRTDRADVICISACRDRESAWEDHKKDGASVARAMLKYLRHDPTPTYKDLMRGIADRIQAQNIERKSYDTESDDEEDNKRNEQNPELSSQVPLHMDDRLYP